jgi:hypothetical protein
MRFLTQCVCYTYCPVRDRQKWGVDIFMHAPYEFRQCLAMRGLLYDVTMTRIAAPDVWDAGFGHFPGIRSR